MPGPWSELNLLKTLTNFLGSKKSEPVLSEKVFMYI